MKQQFLMAAATMFVLAGCGGGEPAEKESSKVTQTEQVAETATESTSASHRIETTDDAVDWDRLLSSLDEDDREEALDLKDDAERKRAKAAEWLAEAREYEAEAKSYRQQGDEDRAQRSEARAASQYERAEEKLDEAREDEARALALASTKNDTRTTNATTPNAGMFGVESFRIVYELEGQTTGTRIMYIEAFGERVGIEETSTTYGESQQRKYYWDGDQGHLQRNEGGEVSSMGLRMKDSEPTAFATTPADDLELVGYERIGDKQVAGITCEHWQNTKLNYEGCRWNGIELEFLNGAGTSRILQRTTATEFEEGVSIPAEIKALAN